MSGLVAAELLKLRTTRTMWALLAATVAISGLAVAGAILAAAETSGIGLESGIGVRSVLAVISSGAIFVLVLGIIMSAGEYRQRTATETFLTTPRRWRVIVAKLVVSVMAGVVFGTLSSAISIAVASQMYRLQGYTFPFDSGDVWTTVAGAVLYAAVFAGLGASTGSLVRNQVVAIVGWLTWLSIVEHLAGQLVPTIGRWLPGAAGRALLGVQADGVLSQRSGGAALVVYSLAIMTVAVVSERYRDA